MHVPGFPFFSCFCAEDEEVSRKRNHRCRMKKPSTYRYNDDNVYILEVVLCNICEPACVIVCVTCCEIVSRVVVG